jgi:hypothetical protein
VRARPDPARAQAGGLSDTPAIPGNQRYYFQVGAGVWRGTFLFRVTSWQRLRGSGIGLKQMSLAAAMAVFTRITGKATIDSEIWAHPEERAFGTASNHVRIHRLGLTLYLLDEVYTLDPDGRSVAVDARERFGPIPFLFRNHKQHPAEINGDGLGSTYYFPLLGSSWVGRYNVDQERRHIDGHLTCDWGEALESMDKLADG